MSEPVSSGVMPAANAAPEPPLDPPTSYAVFQGLRVTPHMRECVQNALENSGVSVRAWMIAPASSIRSTIASDSGDT